MRTETAGLAAARRAFPSLRLTRLARTRSTQDIVRRAAQAGAEEGYCCIADAQTEGRGRQGRRWSAPPGTALLASVLLRPSFAALPGIPIAAGLSVVDALATFGVAALLKWPNDVLVAGRKLAGLLAEAVPATGQSARSGVVLGLGLNISVAEFPADIAGVSLHELMAEPPSRDRVLAAWLAALGARLAGLEQRGVAGLRSDWRRHATGLGEAVTAVSVAGEIAGTAEDIDESGALLIRTADGVIRLVAGDVHLRTSPAP